MTISSNFLVTTLAVLAMGILLASMPLPKNATQQKPSSNTIQTSSALGVEKALDALQK